MATSTAALFPPTHLAPARRPRGNLRGLGLAIAATIGLYVALPIAAGAIAGLVAPVGHGAAGLLELVASVAGCGAAGWYLRSWWLPLVAPLPGIGAALLLWRMMVTSSDPDAGFLIFGVMALVGMAAVVTAGATIGVVAGKSIRAVIG